MTRAAKITAAVFALLLMGCLAVAWLTRGSAPLQVAEPFTVVDRKLLETARQVSALAETPAEIELASQAVRLADHEVDQAYATAVREATDTKPARGSVLEQLDVRLAAIRKQVDERHARIASLEKSAAASDEAAGQLELARAQLALDEDELEDTRLDIERQGGNERSRLEQAAREHAEASKGAAPLARPAPIRTDTLGDQVVAWWTLSERRQEVSTALEKASARKESVEWEHKVLDDMVAQKPVPAGTPNNDDGENRDATLKRLRSLSDQRKTLTELDRRIQDSAQIGDAYRKWIGLLDQRRRAVVHAIVGSLAWIMGILLAVVVAETGVRRALRDGQDRRRTHQQRFLTTLAVRAAGTVIILLIIFGAPSQTPTIIGLITAGLTVALKDFLVAFCGWFVLMGRNGVRVGDWVEIKGVGGEVIELGLFKTVLLEMGNRTNAGHPTGRRVSFMNGYAIESAYFNFSTAGQWLWDELQVTVPPGSDPYATAEKIRAVVERETEADGQLAEQEWERITRQYGTQRFSSRPAVELRPAGGGVEVLVRYITRGPQRAEVKSRLFRQILDVLHTA